MRMPVKKQLLAFVIDNKHDLLTLHMDSDGLDCLIRHLQHLRSSLAAGKYDHFHMFSKDWGDGELTISTMGEQIDDGRAIHQLNAYVWTDESVEAKGFVKS